MDRISNTSVFNPPTGVSSKKQSKPIKSAFSSKVEYYALPAQVSDEARMGFCINLMNRGMSKVKNVNMWKTYVLTYIAALFPALTGQWPASSFTKIDVAGSQYHLYEAAYAGMVDAKAAQDEAKMRHAADGFKQEANLRLLPPVPLDLDVSNLFAEMKIKIIMCHFSLVLFLAGKRIVGDDHSSITVARPKALKGKVHLTSDYSYLEGDHRLSDESHLGINNAWSEMGIIRHTVFTTFAKFNSLESDELQDIVWTSMHLLRFSNMSHALIVFNFIQAYPWVTEIAPLRPSLACYVRSLDAARTMPADELPYIKLIYGDKSHLFPRKEMEPLIACAIAALAETQPTLSAFYSDPALAPIVDAFMEQKQKREGDFIQNKEEEENEDTDEDDGTDVD